MPQENHEKEKHKKQQKTCDQRKAEYRVLLDRIHTLHRNEAIGVETALAVQEILTHANFLFKDGNIKEKLKDTDEALLDARVVTTSSEVLLNVTEAIDCSIDSYNPTEVANKIRLIISSPEDPWPLDWSKIAKTAKTVLKYAPNFSFLYGGVGQTEEKPVKERKQRVSQKTKQGPKKQPEKIISVDKEEDSVDDTVKFLRWALNKECLETGKESLSYFEFIIDPNNFSATIENMFHFSFLVRDGKVKMDVDSNGTLEVSPVLSKTKKTARNEGTSSKQSIVSIDMAEYIKIIEVFNIRSCFLDKWKTKWASKKEEH